MQESETLTGGTTLNSFDTGKLLYKLTFFLIPFYVKVLHESGWEFATTSDFQRWPCTLPVKVRISFFLIRCILTQMHKVVMY